MAVSNRNISALYRAIDIRGLLRPAGALCEPRRVWYLTWPTVADRQILVTESTGEPVDLLIATQIEQLQPPGNAAQDALGNWCRRVVGALGGQFPWLADTSATAAALRGGSPMAVVGLAGSGEDGGMLATEIAHAMERVAILESALLDGAIYRHLLAGCDEALLVIHETGRIVAGTEEGRRLLCTALYGSSRSPYKSCDDSIPARILSSILVGDAISSRGISITACPFDGGARSDLAEPLVLVTFRAVQPTSSNISPERLAKLTPAQTEVFRLLVAGERNKGIAVHLGISPFTARNHVSAVLQTLGCGDRLELIARVRLAEMTAKAKPKMVVHPLVLAPVLENLPLKSRRQRA